MDTCLVLVDLQNDYFPGGSMELVGVGDIVISGAMSHMCIDATVRAAFDLGFTCMVADDACATKNLTFRDKTIHASEVHAAFMAALSGSYATVRPTKAIIENKV